MKSWKLIEFNEEMGEIAAHAHQCGPQRVTVNGKVDVIVLSPSAYTRLSGEPLPENCVERPVKAGSRCCTAEGPKPEPASAKDDDERKWVWEWDEETQSWALPWARDADPAEHPGTEFLNFMQNSPLAQAFRDGDFTPEEWDAACRMGR